MEAPPHRPKGCAADTTAHLHMSGGGQASTNRSCFRGTKKPTQHHTDGVNVMVDCYISILASSCLRLISIDQ